MKKKFFAMLMTLIMAIGCFGSVAFAAEENEWRIEQPVPTPVGAHVTAITVGDEIYFFQYSASNILKYNTKNKQWTEGSEIPPGAVFLFPQENSVKIGNRIYFYVGGVVQNKSVFSIYDLTTDTWSYSEAQSQVIQCSSIAAVGDEIYVFGGYTSSPTTVLNTVRVYNVNTNTWRTGVSLPTVRAHATSIAVDEKIYVFGGVTGFSPSVKTNRVDIFNTATNQWTVGAAMPFAENNRPAVMDDGNIYFGYSYVDGYTDGLLDVYNIESNSWDKLDKPMPIDKLLCGMTAANGRIYMIGGQDIAEDGTATVANTMISYGLAESEDNTLSVLLEEDETARLIVTDRFTDNTDYNWTSSDNSVAEVDANGIVTAIAPGLTYITAESKAGSYTDSIPVRVVSKGEAADERLAVFLDPGEVKNLYLNDDYTNITWTSMDSAVVTVDAMGKITGVAEGLAIVQAEYGSEVYHIYVRVS